MNTIQDSYMLNTVVNIDEEIDFFVLGISACRFIGLDLNYHTPIGSNGYDFIVMNSCNYDKLKLKCKEDKDIHMEGNYIALAGRHQTINRVRFVRIKIIVDDTKHDTFKLKFGKKSVKFATLSTTLKFKDKFNTDIEKLINEQIKIKPKKNFLSKKKNNDNKKSDIKSLNEKLYDSILDEYYDNKNIYINTSSSSKLNPFTASSIEDYLT